MKTIKHYYYGSQTIRDEDIARVVEALRGDLISQGPLLHEFEAAVSDYSLSDQCVACSNGTTGLHLALEAMGVGAGDLVWTTPMTFAATANAVLHTGARVDFVDIDSGTWNMAPEKLADKLTVARKQDRLPKVVVPVHFAGQSCDMEAIAALGREFGVEILEDACHALGGSHEGKPIGSCEYSRAAVFSLHPVKSITTGEGGLVCTNDERLAETMRSKRSHGIARESMHQHEDAGPWHAEVRRLGYNYRITEFQCALGLSQLRGLDEFVAKRRELVRRYMDNIADLPVTAQTVARPDESAWHMFVLLFDFHGQGVDKRTFHAEMGELGVHLSQHYYPVHLHPLYRNTGFAPGMFPNAEAYYTKSFTYPLHPGLDVEDVDEICARLRSVLNKGA